MPDADQDSKGHHGLINDESGFYADRPAQPARRPAGTDPVHQREEAMTPSLPRGRVKSAMIIGMLAGVVSIVQSIIITYVNASTYHAYDIARDQAVKKALAFTIFDSALLTFFITMLICLIAGFIAGRVSVQRRLGFLAGFVAGIINYAVSFITRYIPQYPGNQQAGAAAINNVGTVIGGIVFFLAFLLMWGLLTGLVSLLGAWIATRRHPFYSGY